MNWEVPATMSRRATTFVSVASLLVSIALVGCASRFSGTSGTSNGPQPPVAEKKPHATTLHGATLTDDYFWLREKTNPKVMEYLRAEDAYADEMTRSRGISGGPRIDDRHLQIREVSHISRRQRGMSRQRDAGDLRVAHIHWPPGLLAGGRQ